MDVLAGRYQLDAPLGTGGTATVWRALDVQQRRMVAIKVLPHSGGSDRQRSRLRAEAEVMAALRHPQVLRVFGLGTDGAVDWIAMEYCPGGSLADQLDLTGPLPPRTASLLMIDVLEALSFAHERGVVHRDVKPANILIGHDERARLCDFGIARVASTEFRHTHTGTALGSWAYMAPEQRVDARGVGPRADLYAAGCTLYALVTAATPTDLYLAGPESPRWADVPEELRPLIRRVTSAAVQERHADCRELIRDLQRVMPKLSTHPCTVQGSLSRSMTAAHTAERPFTERHVAPRPERPNFPTPLSPAREVSLDGPRTQLPPQPRRPLLPPVLGDGPAAVIRAQRRRMLAAATAGVVLVCAAALWLSQGVPPAPPSEPLLAPPADVEVSSPPTPLEVQPAGRWHGLWNEHLADLDLSGTEGSFTGQLDLTLPGDHRVALALEGRFDPMTGALHLRDTGTHPNAADYDLRLERHGNLLHGEMVLRRSARRAPVFLVRMQ
ncbi:MAG: serine/threonine protein kinase [Myxococcota bacterium]|jgi:serine/threonine protein kinase